MADGSAPTLEEPVRTPNGAVGVIARMRVGAGLQAEFERFILALAADVARFEPGCLMYMPQRVLGSEREYAVFERYRSWDDFEKHADTLHMQAALREFDRLLDGPAIFEVYCAIP